MNFTTFEEWLSQNSNRGLLIGSARGDSGVKYIATAYLESEDGIRLGYHKGYACETIEAALEALEDDMLSQAGKLLRAEKE